MNFAIIAAGEGSRLAKEGILDPKPLIKINGEPLIARLLRIFTQNGAENIAVICNEQMTKVRDFLFSVREDLRQKGVNLTVVVKSTPSSMHSFYELSKVLPGDDKFIMTTVDTIFNEAEFSDYVQTFARDSEADGIMGLTQYIDDEKPLYVALSASEEKKAQGFEATESSNPRELEDSNLRNLENSKSRTLEPSNSSSPRITGYFDTPSSCTHISAGIYGLTPKSFQTLRRSISENQSRMRNFQRALIADGLLLKPFVFSTVFDIDHAEDIKKAGRFNSNIS